MSPTPKTRVCLVRHGETDWNAEKRVQGQIDIDLNAAGEVQARAIAEGIRPYEFAAAYSSDLRRANRTARLALAGRDISVSPAPALRERHFGVLQGLTAEEAGIVNPLGHRARIARDPDSDFATGESLIDFAARVLAGMEVLAVRHAGQSVIAFTHGGVLDVMYRAATGMAIEAPRNFTLGNAALNWIEYGGGAWRMIMWGQVGHLTGALDELPG